MTSNGRGVATILAIAFATMDPAGGALQTAKAAAPETAPAPGGLEISGRVELLEKGKVSTDRTLLARNTVVFFEPAKKGAAPKPVRAEMSTVKKEFKPRLVVVPVGSTVSFPNLDPILHNVFSISGKNSFDLGLLGKGPGKTATFKEAGIVRVFCNVHHGMFAYVVVVATPYWTTVGDDGRFRIAGVPPGPGKLTVWNERSAPATSDLTLPAAQPLRLGVEITMPRIPPHKNKLGRSYGGSNYG
jgi:plastocyanin